MFEASKLLECLTLTT